jgi:hypothetical protein
METIIYLSIATLVALGASFIWKMSNILNMFIKLIFFMVAVGCLFELLIALGSLPQPVQNIQSQILWSSTFWFALWGIIWDKSDWLNFTIKMVFVSLSIFGLVVSL